MCAFSEFSIDKNCKLSNHITLATDQGQLFLQWNNLWSKNRRQVLIHVLCTGFNNTVLTKIMYFLRIFYAILAQPFVLFGSEWNFAQMFGHICSNIFNSNNLFNQKYTISKTCWQFLWWKTPEAFGDDPHRQRENGPFPTRPVSSGLSYPKLEPHQKSPYFWKSYLLIEPCFVEVLNRFQVVCFVVSEPLKVLFSQRKQVLKLGSYRWFPRHDHGVPQKLDQDEVFQLNYAFAVGLIDILNKIDKYQVFQVNPEIFLCENDAEFTWNTV